MAGNAAIMAVVKAAAYGHGLIRMSQEFADCGADYLAVSFLEEGIILRENGIDIPILLGGAVVTETIFAWPGMGRLFIDHLNRYDLPVVMGILMLISIAVILSQLLTDIVYAWLDPRIRYD